ncbi:PUA-like domain-containing protein [Phlebopus sp. FC_14]|nr:PUA-like domain-containing protein [Phlebopus sp. FC_14]
MFRDLFSLFHCPLCPPGRFLAAPCTLACGHTVCASHISSSTCPIPSCSSSSHPGPPPSIPSSSRVAFCPAPPVSPQTSSPGHLAQRVDVRVNNIVELLRADAEQLSGDVLGTCSNSDDESDGEQSWQPDPSDAPLHLPSTLSHPPSPDLNSHHRLDPPVVPVSPPCITSPEEFEKALSSELNCEICFMMLYQPVTTPCQHTFCSKCLQRSLDHSMLCPLCREDLPGFAYFQEHPYNKVILSLLLKAYPDAYASRGEAVEREQRDSRLDTPIFVCQLSFPGMPTLLHFFEPRYRLMLRRCLEGSSHTFGMIMPPRAAPLPGRGTNTGSEFGTMLEIKSVQMLPDGRSMVETWGTHRFRVLESGSLDGYMVGRVERIDDYDDDLSQWLTEGEEEASASAAIPPALQRSPPLPHFLLTRIMSNISTPPPPPVSAIPSSSSSPSASHLPSTSTLLAACHAFLMQLRAGTAPWVVQRLNHTYGPQPPDTDPGAFSFWMGMVLPIDEHEKAKLLPVKSARLRLRMVVGWIEQLNNYWWFSSGCIVI